MAKRAVNKPRSPKPQHHPAYIRLRVLLREWREERGLTQRQVADRLNRPQSYVAKVETGSRRIDPIEWLAFLDAIDMERIDAVRQLPSNLGHARRRPYST